MLYDITLMTAIRVGEKPIAFLMQLDPALPRCLLGDSGRVKQILINIIGNAIKFTDHGAIKLLVNGRREQDDWALRFEVKDTGIGIREEDLAMLFGNFNQVNVQRNRNIEGTGLGLSISQKLAEMMGGGITVTSEYEVGSSFVITFKQGFAGDAPVLRSIKANASVLICEPSDILREYEDACMKTLLLQHELCSTGEAFEEKLRTGTYTHAIARRSVLNHFSAGTLPENTRLVALYDLYEHALMEFNASSLYVPLLALHLPYVIRGITEDTCTPKYYAGLDAAGIEAMPHVSILIVDDNPVNIRVAMGLMEPYAMQMDQVQSGEQAISAVQSRDYDLVLMDHMMPGMSGIEATKIIRALEGEKYKTLPIVALTANASSEARQMFLCEGEVDFALGLHRFGAAQNYCELLEIYLTSTKEKLPKLAGWLENDLGRFVIEIHAFKSASAAVGVLKLSAIAAEMEQQGDEKHTEEIAAALPDFLARSQNALREMEHFLEREAPPAVLPPDSDRENAAHKKHIVVVDDDAVNLELAERVLQSAYHITTLTSGEKLLEFLEKISPDMILLDIRMPGMDGYETLNAILRREEWRRIPVIFLTGQKDVQSEREGLRLGAKDFIIKPFDNVIMLSRVRAQMELSQYQTELKEIISNKTQEVEGLQHIITVSWEERSDLLRSSSLHDIGKVGISDLVLKKPSKLTAEELSAMQRHSKIGCDMIQKIIDSTRPDRFLLYARDMALYHHERWDGTGYPCGLKGDEIPLYVQVLTMADVFDALTAIRPYKRAYTFEESIAIMCKERGTFYCPERFDVFLENKAVMQQILNSSPQAVPSKMLESVRT